MSAIKVKLVLSAVLAGLTGGFCAANLISNAGFESGTLDGWVNNGYYVGSGGDAHSGVSGAACEVPTGVGAGSYFIMDQSVPVTAGMSYDASCWMRQAGTANNSEQFLEIQWMNSSDEIMWVSPYASTPVSSPHEYALVTLENCVAPEGAAKADIRAVVHTTALTTDDTAWHTFDDFSFVAIPEPASMGLLSIAAGLMYLRRKKSA